MKKYRKIYEKHYGIIPVDLFGRTYDIHHIDGDHCNNDPLNLKAVTIQEHYDIHHNQGDLAACQAILMRMNVSTEEIKKIANLRVENGTHNWLDGEKTRQSQLKRVENGMHQFLGGKIQRESARKLVEEGKHHMIGGKIQRESARKLVEEGKHIFLGGEIQKRLSEKRIENGTHHFVQNNPNKTLLTCPHCEKTGSAPAMKRWHYKNCKLKINR